jgi:dihydroneopterin triphosphate diphosphatase
MQILCLQRTDVPSFWQSVTGSLLEKELPEQAALRELEEETGLTTANGGLINCHKSWWFDIYPHWQHRYPEGTTKNLEHVFLFLMDEIQPIALSKEHVSYRWLPIEEAIVIMGSNSNKKAILEFLVEID